MAWVQRSKFVRVEDKTPVDAEGKTTLRNEKTFWIEVKSQEEDKTYTGEFTVKRLTIGDQSRLGGMVARLAGGIPVDQATEYINLMLATFEIALTKKPEWFKPAELFDPVVLDAVYQEVMIFFNSFRRAVQEQLPAAEKGSEG